MCPDKQGLRKRLARLQVLLDTQLDQATKNSNIQHYLKVTIVRGNKALPVGDISDIEGANFCNMKNTDFKFCCNSSIHM